MRVEVFAVEDTSIQVCWTGAATGPIEVFAEWPDGHATVAAGESPGPGAVVLGGLPASTTMRVGMTGRGRTSTVTTLAPPPGRRLSRFAAINDMHLGARSFGTALDRIWDDDPTDPAPVRCMRAALAEAVAWGADAVVVKGDLTSHGRPHEWEGAGLLLHATGLPIVMIEGNHETKLGSVDGRAAMSRHGIDLAVNRPTSLDLPGVRIVGVPTARWHFGSGLIAGRVASEAVSLVADASAGAVIALHHYPQRFRYPTLYPSGMPGPHASSFLDALAAAHPATLVLAGHSHRHRRHDHGPLTVAETGSTKDFPGSWAGYTVHEGGIMQTTRRVMDPAAIAWTERGRGVLGGVWGVWAPGLRSHRCFSYVWPTS
ncbi:MAG: metallophosphoesterase family protein [Acidimicrobiales bacterium]